MGSSRDATVRRRAPVAQVLGAKRCHTDVITDVTFANLANCARKCA